MNRRDFLLRGVGIAGMAGLTACHNGLPALPVDVKLPTNLSTLIDDVNMITSKVSSLAPSLPASAQSLLAKLKSTASSIANSSVVQTATGALNDFATTWNLLKPMIPSSGSTIVSAVETVLPEALQIAGLIGMFAARAPTGMTIMDAKRILRS